jgi:hypothetical protein
VIVTVSDDEAVLVTVALELAVVVLVPDTEGEWLDDGVTELVRVPLGVRPGGWAQHSLGVSYSPSNPRYVTAATRSSLAASSGVVYAKFKIWLTVMPFSELDPQE